MSFYVELALCVVLLPTLVTGNLVALGLRKSAGLVARSFGQTAVGAGFVVGYLALPWTPLRPEDTWHWIPLLAVGATTADLLRSEHRFAAKRVCARLTVASLCAWLLVPTWPDFLPVRYPWIGVMALAVTLVWFSLEQMLHRLHRITTILYWGGILTAGCAVLFLSGSAKFSELLAIVAVAFFGAAAIALVTQKNLGLASAIPVLAVSLPGLILNGRFYSFSSVPLASYLLILVAPILVVVIEFAVRTSHRTACASIAKALPPGILIATAITLAATS